jgi:hypothetical protein
MTFPAAEMHQASKTPAPLSFDCLALSQIGDIIPLFSCLRLGLQNILRPYVFCRAT